MRRYRVRGGVHPPERKALSAEYAIVDLPLPDRLYLPLQQHIGAPAKVVVNVGDKVAKGQCLAVAQGPVSAPVHAPTSGVIERIHGHPAHHASGLKVPTIVLRADGEDRWVDGLTGTDDPFGLSAQAIAERVAEAGIVGLGGAGFPAAVKLNLGQKYDLNTLVINGAECEPYLTCDDRLMQEHGTQVVLGARIMAHALGVNRVIFAIENNKRLAQIAIRAAAGQHSEIAVVGLATRYPMGSERHLVQAVTGLESPARGLTAEIGVVVHNPATAYAVYDAVCLGRPLTHRVMTISGEAVHQPGNFRVALGTPIQSVLDYCGGATDDLAMLVSGGPMMGQPLPSTEVPTVKGGNAVLCLTSAEIKRHTPQACIRCGQCVNACPMGLLPLEIAACLRADDLDSAVAYGLMDCINCGSCTFACPAHNALGQYFHYGKGRLGEHQRLQKKQGMTKALAEARAARMEAIKAAKRAAMAKRKQAQSAATQEQTPV